MISSIIYGDNEFLNDIDQDSYRIIQMLGDSFSMNFGSESDKIAVMDFYKNEILNPDKIKFFMTLMDSTILDLYYTANIPDRFGKLIRYVVEDSFLDILDKFRMAKDEKDYFGVTVFIHELRSHLGFDISLSTISNIASVAMSKKYELSDHQTLESEYYFDIYMKDKQIAQKLYKFFKRSFKNIEAYNKMRISLKLD